MTTKIGKLIMEDDWRHQGPGNMRNFPKPVDSPVVEEWFEPSPDGRISGKEFVKTEDGRTFWRYDCYARFSPYGYDELKPDETKKE